MIVFFYNFFTFKLADVYKIAGITLKQFVLKEHSMCAILERNNQLWPWMYACDVTVLNCAKGPKQAVKKSYKNGVYRRHPSIPFEVIFNAK